jgi:hypothetical protein
MGRFLTPAAMVAAMLGFAVAALTAGLTPYQPAWWRGAVALAILGGITPMIFAVNLRIVPVFSRRAWPARTPAPLAMAVTLAGAWTIFAGVVAGLPELVTAGNALALAGGILFTIAFARLFRQPVTLPAPPLPYPGQTAVDRIATRFMRLSGTYLLLGLLIGLVTSVWWPESGRWDLVWAHTMLVGFFLSMVSGVCYHVLARWTGREWRTIAPIRAHFIVVALGLPLMLLALASDQDALLAIAGPLQAAAIGLLLLNIAPMIPALPGLTRPAFAMAALLLLAGITLGALFALDPVLGARLRLTHAEINLFGWTGLLISGAGYYLVPRFAGQPLRWPRLAQVQLGALFAGVVLGAAAFAWRAYGGGAATLVLVAQALVAAGFLLFGVLVAGTFRPAKRAGAGTVSALPLAARPAKATVSS